MDSYSFQGTPYEIGRQIGKAMPEKIRYNLSQLVWREGYEPLPKPDPRFIAWWKEQEEIIGTHWPWLLEEMRGVAEGSGQAYQDIFWLSIRAWSFTTWYGIVAPAACSTMAVTLKDGTLACAGSLDCNHKFYAGMCRFAPDRGYRFLTVPFSGLGGCGRMNEKGLVLGTAGQGLPGLPLPPKMVVPDILQRVMMQTCATVEEARELMREHAIFGNYVFIDGKGKLLCAHSTPAGLIETARKTPCALTNHIPDDQVMYRLFRQGAKEFPEPGWSRLRRGKLADFGLSHDRKCAGQEVRKMIADRENGAPSSICPAGNVYVYYANPQAHPGKLWAADPQVSGHERWRKFTI